MNTHSFGNSGSARTWATVRPATTARGLITSSKSTASPAARGSEPAICGKSMAVAIFATTTSASAMMSRTPASRYAGR